MGETTGDEARFEAMYRDCAPAVIAYARRRLREPSDADDVLVETFAVAWRRRQVIPADPLPWLYATAGNVLAHMLRSQARRGRLDARLAAQGREVLMEQSAAITGDDRLLAALDTLSEPDREILRLWAWEDLDGPRLAQALGCQPNAARTRLHRAKTRLRTALAATTGTGQEGTA